MMKKLFARFILVGLCISSSHAAARIPDGLYVSAHGGVIFPGIRSEGTAFIGRTSTIGLVYRPHPEAKIGFHISAGFQINSYRHNFEKDIFITHVQKGFSCDLFAVMKVSEHASVVTGIAIYTPYTVSIDIGQRNFNQTYYFGSDSLWERYEIRTLQAGVVAGAEYEFGKKQNVSIGFRVSHAGISPVKKDAVYYDGLGHSVVVSRIMKPLSVQLNLMVRIQKPQKKNHEP